MKTIGFFGGSFDPIHFGHINLAIQLLEIHKLDEVLFCPAWCSPFKTASLPKASPEHRLAMLKLALKGILKFQISTLEIDRKGPSYTIDTLRSLYSPSTKLHLLLSEDAFSRFGEWKEAEELIRLAPPIIGTRRGSAVTKSVFDQRLAKGFTQTKDMEISSTEVRNRLKNKLYCGHLVPAVVLDYIRANELFKNCLS